MSTYVCLIILCSWSIVIVGSNESCGPTTYCPDGSRCCSAETCCPEHLICCHGYYCCSVPQVARHQPQLYSNSPNIEMPRRRIYHFYFAQLPKGPTGNVLLNLTRIGSSLDGRR